MKRKRTVSAGFQSLVKCCIVWVCAGIPAWAETEAGRVEQQNSRCMKQLAESTEVDFIDTPFIEAIEVLKEMSSLPIHIDHRRLSAVGIDIESPISLQLNQVSAESALTMILDSVSDDLDFAIREGNVLVSTSPGKLLRSIETRVYNVADLLQAIGPAKGPRMVEILNESMRLRMPGRGNSQPVLKTDLLDNALSVTCSLANHRHFHRLLRAHRSAVASNKKSSSRNTNGDSRKPDRAEPNDDLFGGDPAEPGDELDDLFN